ncbi:Squalene epoxidase, partial [Nowakowskiella sp. JEL0407]
MGISSSKITAADKSLLDIKIQRDKLKQYITRLSLLHSQAHSQTLKNVAAKNIPSAKLSLKKEKYFYNQLEQVQNQLSNLEHLVSEIEYKRVEVGVLDGLKKGNEILKGLNEQLKVLDVEKVLDDLQDGVEYQKEIDDLISGVVNMDDEEIEMELEKLREEEERPVKLPDVPVTDIPQTVNVGKEEIEFPEIPDTAVQVKPEKETSKKKYEVVIIGGGILGCAAAAALGNDGREVLLIERDWKEPDRIVGELLQPGGVKALQELGLADTLNDIDGITVNGYAVISSSDDVVLPYPNIPNQPIQGVSFHHGRFVMKLREAAEKAKNVTCLEATATDLLYESNVIIGVKVSIKNSTDVEELDINADLTLICDGCFSKFRKGLVKYDPALKSHFAGLILENCTLPYPNHGHVVLVDPSPILLYQIGTNDTRILVDIPGRLPSSTPSEKETESPMVKYMKNFVLPQLPKQVHSSFLDALATQKVRVMPNSWLPPSDHKLKGGIILGDAFNMRHPLTGGGMTVAFWDVVHLRNALSVKKIPLLTDVPSVQKEMKVQVYERGNVALAVNMLAMMLYALFSGANEELKILRNGCFAYFKLGGSCVSTPVGLLGGSINMQSLLRTSLRYPLLRSRAPLLPRTTTLLPRTLSIIPSRVSYATATPEPKNLSQAEAFLNGPSATYIEEMYTAWLQNPASVHLSWQVYFRNMLSEGKYPAFMPPPNIIPQAASTLTFSESPSEVENMLSAYIPTDEIMEHMKVQLMVRAYQVRGHHLARIDPLEIINADIQNAPELDYKHYGFGEADLDRKFFLGSGILPGFLEEGERKLTLRDLLDKLQKTYCGSIGIEYGHIPDRIQCDWIREKFEVPTRYQYTKEQKHMILDRLLWSDLFEKFVATKYPTEKRFGVEGCEALIPGMKAL